MAAPPLPVTVLTGFLGAGKTTLLRRLLAAPHGRRIGVILNELGQTGIDDLDQARRRELIELSEGCVCCTRSPDLIRALGEMYARGDVDLVIVETTGLADPLALTWTITRPDVQKVARLDSVITVVDALNLDRRASDEWGAQVRSADLVVVTKLEETGAASLEAVRAAVVDAGGGARLIDGRGELPIAALLDAWPDPDAATRRAALAAPTARHSGYVAVSIVDADGAYAPGPLEDLIEDLPEAVFRAKGIVRVEGGDFAAFHAVGGRVAFEPKVVPPDHGETRIVCLGPGLDEAELRRRFAACLAG
jgi:G3E family GTPase